MAIFKYPQTFFCRNLEAKSTRLSQISNKIV